MRVCSIPGCPTLYQGNSRHCPAHAKQQAKQRGTRQARGYGAEHQRARTHWATRIATGTINCWRCGKPIHPNQPWDLGHDDNDRSITHGPEHQHCNRSAGGRSAHKR